MIDVGLVVSVRNANGDNNTKTFTNTYRIEYVITKFKIPKETKVLIIPSNEKISNASVFIDMIEFNLLISVEKLIEKSKVFSPINLIVLLNKELI